MPEKRNLTIQLDAEVVRKARVLAAQRSTSISRLVGEQIEAALGEEAAYEAARRQALATLEHGFALGARSRPDRAELHER